MKNFLYDVMQGKHPEKTADYFDGDIYIQHNTSITDGLSELGAALAALTEQGVADDLRQNLSGFGTGQLGSGSK